jgi:hypothetical protein
VVLAERHHGAGLRTFRAFPFLRHKAHLGADLQSVEAAIGDAVAVEVDLARIGGDKAAIAVGQQARDAAVIRDAMRLRLAASNASRRAT